MLRPKNCKKCGGKMKMQSGGAPYSNIPEANTFAKDFAIRRGNDRGDLVHVGNEIPYFVNNAPNLPSIPLTSYVPPEITSLEWSSDMSTPYYVDPKTGDMVYTPASYLNLPRFQSSRDKVKADVANFVAKRMQRGGFPYPIPMESEEEMIQRSINEMQSQNPEFQQVRTQLNPIQDMISRGLLETPEGYSSAEQWYADMQKMQTQPKPTRDMDQTMQNIGLAMRGVRTGLSALSGAVERGRQNRYEWMQNTALGQMNPMPTNDFQPNPYSLYAKYGGNLKTIMKEHSKWTNDVKPMDFGMGPYDDKGTMKKGGSYDFDRAVVMRKIIPELLDLGRLTKSKYRQLGGEMKKGGIYIKPENRGKFTDYCGGRVTEECIQKGLDSPSATIRKRANFARNARKWN